MKRRCITGVDLVLIAVCLGVAVFLFLLPLMQKSGGVAVVRINNETVARLPLDTDATQTVQTKEGYNTVSVQDGVCLVSKADCRDGICIKRGAVSKVGESIVCLPHKLIVEIEAP